MRQRPELAAASTWTIEIDDEGVEIGRNEPCGEPAYVAWEFFRRSNFYHPTVIMRADAFAAVGVYDETMPHAEDYDLFARMVMAGMKLAVLERHLLSYRRGSGSITQVLRGSQVAFASGVRERYHKHWLHDAPDAASLQTAAAFMGWKPFDWATLEVALPLLRAQRNHVWPAANARARAAIDRTLLDAVRRRADEALRDTPSAAARLARFAMTLPGQRTRRLWWNLLTRAGAARFGRWRRGMRTSSKSPADK